MLAAMLLFAHVTDAPLPCDAIIVDGVMGVSLVNYVIDVPLPYDAIIVDGVTNVSLVY